LFNNRLTIVQEYFNNRSIIF